MSDKKGVVQLLHDISTGKLDLGNAGICDQLVNMLGVFDGLGYSYTPQNASIMDFLKDRMEEYANKQGTLKIFPVPHPSLRPISAYYCHRESGSSMNDTSEYGLNRRKLAEILANELDRSGI